MSPIVGKPTNLERNGGKAPHGLLEWHQRLIRVPDWDALVKRAEFEPSYLQTQVRPEQRIRIVQAS